MNMKAYLTVGGGGVFFLVAFSVKRGKKKTKMIEEDIIESSSLHGKYREKKMNND